MEVTMKRWHEERSLMIRRWREEIAKHESWLPNGETGYSYCALAPVPPERNGDCHCYLGMGFMRKRRPHDCGKPRCTLCHFEKFHVPKNRALRQREAIDYELRAHGL